MMVLVVTGPAIICTAFSDTVLLLDHRHQISPTFHLTTDIVAYLPIQDHVPESNRTQKVE